MNFNKLKKKKNVSMIMIQTLDSQISEGKGRSTTSMISKLFKYFSKESAFLNVPGILYFPKFYKIIIDSL